MSNKIFDKISLSKQKMSAFDLSREQKLSARMGDLVPTYFEEIVPGDQFSVKSEIMMRLAPMISPLMHRVDVYMHYFFVPNRLVWDEWEDFITGGAQGDTNPVLPTFDLSQLTSTSGKQNRLANYFGLPTQPIESGGELGVRVSQLPFRAYNLIYNEYYLDQNLQDPIDISSLTPAQARLVRWRAWEKDYFTSALPWRQRTANPVEINVDGVAVWEYNDITKIRDSATGDLVDGTQYPHLKTFSALGSLVYSEDAESLGTSAIVDNIKSLDVDGIGFDILELRRAARLQEWLEKQARGGSRYAETILSHFGVRSSDARLQRPEYLGGGKQPIVISEVLNTTGTTNAPQGDMAGHGISVGGQNRFSKRFEEHGYVIGIMSVLPKTAYQEGISRTWTRKDKFDYYWPEFANIGEQEIKNKELYATGDPEEDEETFGYQQRYAEYKYGQSTVHGDMRTSLAHWHLGRIFNHVPTLQDGFVIAHNIDTNRVFAVSDEDHLWVQLYHNVKARRPMPFFADPRL